MDTNVDFEKELVRGLKSKHFDKEELSFFSSTIADLRKRGMLIDRIWRYGIPVPDGIRVAGSVSATHVGKIGELLLDDRFSKWKGFPKGIPRPIEVGLEVYISVPGLKGEIPG